MNGQWHALGIDVVAVASAESDGGIMKRISAMIKADGFIQQHIEG